MKNAKVILYFTAGLVATAVEAAEIARLQTGFGSVFVRNGQTAADTLFGTRIEPCDYVAGKSIPAAYTDADKGNKTVLTVPSAINPDDFKVFPATLTIDASDVDVQTPAAVKAAIDANTGFAAMTNMTGDATCTWLSSDATKATVNAATGKITAVAAGATTITATYAPGTAVALITAEADDETLTKVAHGFTHGQSVKMTALTGGTGFTNGNTYYVIYKTVDTFQLATSYANAIAGTPQAISADGTGITLIPSPVSASMALTVQA